MAGLFDQAAAEILWLYVTGQTGRFPADVLLATTSCCLAVRVGPVTWAVVIHGTACMHS
jgi:hypothetical protein